MLCSQNGATDLDFQTPNETQINEKKEDIDCGCSASDAGIGGSDFVQSILV